MTSNHDQQPATGESVDQQPTETARDRLNNFTPLPLTPFQVAMQGWTPVPDSFDYWPNSVRVEAVEGYQDDMTCGDCIEGRCHWGGEESEASAAAAEAGRDYVDASGETCGCERHETSVAARGRADSEWQYADSHGTRHLVEIDTNYKPGRDSEHPVRLTRADAVQLAAHLLTAVEDTFHLARVGRLRATEAAELLKAIEQTEFVLGDLRSHALGDLLDDTGIEPREDS